MRTIDEIKESIAADFMKNEAVADLFGFPTGDNFAKHFSKVSVINLLFYTFASAAWVVERLFEAHKAEVEARIEAAVPHRAQWYKTKTLEFMKDRTLVTDTDRYDTSGMTDDAIEAARTVKYAAAVESRDASILTIKVAGESGGCRAPLAADEERQLAAYLAEIKDAGVRIDLVNREPDTFDCKVDLYYDAMLLPENVEAACRDAIVAYIENLPFNGEYTNMALVDALQAVEGVRIVEFKQASALSADGLRTEAIDARHIPTAGYFRAGEIDLTMKAHE